jgi:hypothetical protein
MMAITTNNISYQRYFKKYFMSNSTNNLTDDFNKNAFNSIKIGVGILLKDMTLRYVIEEFFCLLGFESHELF